ncbi:MAG TPA: response regulator transcription factor [Caldilineaceae bacterium]|nr:response regulator transcription factor [Caldilineaceae bacterium]
MAPARVVITDDSHVYRKTLRDLLDSLPEVAVVGEASDGQEVVPLVRAEDPDILVLDLYMPHTDGIEVLRTLTHMGARVRVLVHSAYMSEPLAQALLTAGAAACVPKGDIPALIQTIQRLCQEIRQKLPEQR